MLEERTTMRSIAEILEYKRKLAEEIGRELSTREREGALKDHHSKRAPRPCGMTIHTGIGCSLRCIYCYIEDMGFPWSVKPYPLNGKQLVYALLNNPYFIPGKNGTLIALGSVTEPFLPETRRRTLEYIKYISKYLGNPIQFSTKMTLDDKTIEEIKRYDPGISPLITIITIKYHKKLEPYAPSPWDRFETIKKLHRKGLKPILFYRPIIPGIAEEEYMDILREAKKYGAVGVVAGSLRVTRLILSRLKTVGIPIDKIMERLPRTPKGHEQVSIYTRDIKREIMRYARSIGLIAFPEACMANIYTHGYRCWKMEALKIQPQDVEKPLPVDIKEIARELGELRIKPGVIKPLYDKGLLLIDLKTNRNMRKLLAEYIKCKYKICVRIT